MVGKKSPHPVDHVGTPVCGKRHAGLPCIGPPRRARQIRQRFVDQSIGVVRRAVGGDDRHRVADALDEVAQLHPAPGHRGAPDRHESVGARGGQIRRSDRHSQEITHVR